MWKFYLLILVTNVIATIVQNQHFKDTQDVGRNIETTLLHGPAKQRSVRAASSFYGAPKKRDGETIFQMKDTEFVLISNSITHEKAVKRCVETYKGRLAQLRTVAQADFIAEALAETNLVNSSVWISAKMIDNYTGDWYWFEGDKQLEQFSEEIRQLIDIRIITDRNTRFTWNDKENATKEIHKMIAVPELYKYAPAGLDCMSIDRLYLDLPRYFPAACSEMKPILCERPVSTKEGPSVSMDSSHPGWIKLSKQYCKIFTETIIWEEAVKKCHSIESTLAPLKSFPDCSIMARFLKIGRPSIDRAWINGKYESPTQKFKYEDGRVLDSVPNNETFPPWRDGVQQQKKGCLALDRDTSNSAVFLPLNCMRKRAYICCRDDKGNGNDIQHSAPQIDQGTNKTVDVTLDEVGYRVYYQKMSWETARDKCNSLKEKYGGKLVEVREKSTVKHLLNLMAEGVLDSIFHLWVGGKYDNNKGNWNWASDNSEISGGKILNWVKNESFYVDVEEGNQCLNMDRVDALEAEFYGTQCSWGQYFVCEFSRTQLEALQKDEANK